MDAVHVRSSEPGRGVCARAPAKRERNGGTDTNAAVSAERRGMPICASPRPVWQIVSEVHVRWNHDFCVAPERGFSCGVLERDIDLFTSPSNTELVSLELELMGKSWSQLQWNENRQTSYVPLSINRFFAEWFFQNLLESCVCCFFLHKAFQYSNELKMSNMSPIKPLRKTYDGLFCAIFWVFIDQIIKQQQQKNL